MRELELRCLRGFLGLDEADLEQARRAAEGTFAWNVALDRIWNAAVCRLPPAVLPTAP